MVFTRAPSDPCESSRNGVDARPRPMRAALARDNGNHRETERHTGFHCVQKGRLMAAVGTSPRRSVGGFGELRLYDERVGWISAEGA